MFIHNKIKAIYNWAIGTLFLCSCIYEILNKPEQAALFEMLIIASFIPILYGIHILLLKRELKIFEELIIIVPWYVLCTLLIHYTNGIYSCYFPCFYLVVLIYTALIKDKSYYIIFNIIGIITLISWALFSNQDLIWSNVQMYILYVLIYLASFLVIRYYCSICLFFYRDK